MIHLLRLEVKHLEAYVELISVQHYTDSPSAIPVHLNKLFNLTGKLRKIGLEKEAILAIAKNKKLLQTNSVFTSSCIF